MKRKLILIAVMALAVSSTHAAEPATTRAAKWYATDRIGDSWKLQKQIIDVTPEQALAMFDNSPTHLAADWKKQLGAEPKEIENADPLPTDPKLLKIMQSKAEQPPFARVVAFSADAVVVRVVQPIGHYLWHELMQDLATVRVARTPEIDRRLAVASIAKPWLVTYKGIGHGDTDAELRAAAGEPTDVETTQAMEYVRLHYPNGVTIHLWQGRVHSVQMQTKD